MNSLSGVQLDRLQESLRVPALLSGRYQILKVLGRGGMGVVYLAEDSRLQRQVAVKVIDPGVASPELEARLEGEARLLARLAHPGIVPIHDLGRQDDLTLFYVMKHVDGDTLERWLPSHPSRSERLRLFLKLCDPVSFAHAQGVAHRDLKPANVMIGAFGEVLIMDWGLARSIDDSPDGAAVGTPGYRDPSPSDLLTADVYSLGAILFFMLTGQHPRESSTPLQPRLRDSDIDKRLNAICMRATEAHPVDRYISVRELEDDVLRYLDGEAIQAYHERWYEWAGRLIRRYQLLLSIILMYLIMRVVVALIR